jgi:hypothetical protein
MPNPVVHFEVSGPDAATLQSFYGSLFDWKIDADNEMKYGMVATQEGAIGGGVGPSPDGNGSVTWYVRVDDLQASLDKAESLGGKTVNPPMDVPGGPSIAHFSDPAGNVIGILKGT